MAGKSGAVSAGRELEDEVERIAAALGLRVQRQVPVGRRLWGAKRKVDLVLMDAVSRKILGIECKAQATAGSAEEKIPATIHDIAAWPMPGLVVFDGTGFSEHMRSYLISTGKAVELHELEEWLRMFFVLYAS